VFFGAVVLVGFRTSNIENTITKRAKRDGRMSKRTRVRECDFQQRDVMDHRRGDGRDEQENGGDEEEECADVMNESRFSHDEFSSRRY